MATTTCTAIPPKKDSCTILYAGTIPAGATRCTKAVGFDIMSGYRVTGTKVTAAETDATIAAGTDTKPTYKPYSSGTYAYWVNNKFVVRRLSTTISGVANTKLYFGASNWAQRRSVNSIHQIRTLNYSAWNHLTGAATYTASTDILHWSGDTANDKEARPTRAIPGRLTYLPTGKSTTSANYPKKTG